MGDEGGQACFLGLGIGRGRGGEVIAEKIVYCFFPFRCVYYFRGISV